MVYHNKFVLNMMKEKEDAVAPTPKKLAALIPKLRKKKIVYRPPVVIYKSKKSILNAYEPQYDKNKLPPV